MNGIFRWLYGKSAASSGSCSCADGTWTCNLQFFPCDEFQKTDCKESTFFKQGDLDGTMKGLLDNEIIEEIMIYATPLCITCFKSCCKHQYFVFRTQRWWYSLEKFPQYITFQRGSQPEMVKDNIIGCPRKDPKQEGGALKLQIGHQISVHRIITILFEQKELRKPYKIPESDCIRFVEDVGKALSVVEDTQAIAGVTIDSRLVSIKATMSH